jgi:hypothetical protein
MGFDERIYDIIIDIHLGTIIKQNKKVEKNYYLGYFLKI